MKLFFAIAAAALCAAAQTTEPIVGTVTIPAGVFQLPLTAQPPLVLAGATLSCPDCGSGGGGGTTSNLLPWQPISQAPPPALANWTEVNGGANGQFADVRGGILINSVAGNTLKYTMLPTPGAAGSAFTVTAHFSGQCAVNGYPGYGLIVGDGGTNIRFWKYTTSNMNASAGALEVEHWASATTWVSAPYYNQTAGATGDTWLRVKYDGANLTYWASPTGTDDATFVQFFGEGLGFVPSKIGFAATSQSTGVPCVSVLGFWNPAQP